MDLSNYKLEDLLLYALRSEIDSRELYTKISKKTKTLIITILISIVFLIFGIITGDSGIIGNMIILATFVVTIPQMLATYVEYRKLKEMELRFPDFLRDLVELQKPESRCIRRL